MTPRRVGLGILAALVLALVPELGAGSVPRAGAQPTIELAGVDPTWTPVGGDTILRLDVADAPPGLVVGIVAHQAMTSRTAFDDSLDGTELGSVLDSVAFGLDGLDTDATGARLLRLGLQAPTAPRDANRLPLSRTGVYPLEVELRDQEGNRQASFVMPLVVVAPGPDNTPTVGARLDLAWVWPVTAQAAVRPDGKPDPEVVADLALDGRLGRQAAALATAPGVPVTLAPGAETLDSWNTLGERDPELAAGFTSLRTALPTRQVLAGPFVPIDISALVSGGLGFAVGAELAQGTETLGTVLGARLDPRTALGGEIDEVGFLELADARVDRMVVPQDVLVPRDEQFTPAQPFMLGTQGRLATAVASDDGLEAIVDGNGPPALRAQQFLAGLSLIALEQPNVQRGVAVVNPPDWDAPPTFLSTVLGALVDHPLVQPVTVDQMINQVPVEADDQGAPVSRELKPRLAPAPPVSASDFLAARSRLDAFTSLVPPGDLRVAAGERALLTALYAGWQDGDGRRRARAELGIIDTSIDQVLSQLRVPVGNTVTITARKGTVPVTFLNETDQTLRVRVRLESDKLFFPDGAERELELPPRNTTVGFKVESRASGTFPLKLTVTSADGRLVIQEARVRVRSTFVSGVGVFLTVGAVVFLAGWWLLHGRRRRRARRHAALHPSLPDDGDR